MRRLILSLYFRKMCPPRYGYAQDLPRQVRNAEMKSLIPTIPHVTMWGLPQFDNGGMVAESHVNIPNGILKKDDPDRVLVRLMPGELVVPKKHVSLVSQFLKKNGIKLSGM